MKFGGYEVFVDPAIPDSEFHVVSKWKREEDGTLTLVTKPVITNIGAAEPEVKNGQ